MTNVNNDRDTPHSCNVACCFANTLYTSTDVSLRFGQLPVEKGKAQTAPHLTLCQFMHHRFGQGVYLFSRQSSLEKVDWGKKYGGLPDRLHPKPSKKQIGSTGTKSTLSKQRLVLSWRRPKRRTPAVSTVLFGSRVNAYCSSYAITRLYSNGLVSLKRDYAVIVLHSPFPKWQPDTCC